MGELLNLKSTLDNINWSIKSQLAMSRFRKEEKAVAAIKINSQYFYSFARKFSKVQSKIGPLKDATGQFV